MSLLDAGIEASALITRAHSARAAAWEALRRMRRRPRNFKAVRDYVAASAMVEQAELEILLIKRSLKK